MADVFGFAETAAAEAGGKPIEDIDLSAPEGLSQTYWESRLEHPVNANLKKKLTDPGVSKAEKQRLLKRFTESARQGWDALPEPEKNGFLSADEGNGLDPNSVKGKFTEDQADIDAERDLANQDWEGIDVEGLNAAVEGAAAGDAAAVEKLKGILAGIKDPEIADYVGDYVAQTAQADPRDIEAQQRQLSKFESLSDPRITAEEKLMMEMARREAESSLRGSRGALANNLQARGVYGSGSEITLNAMAQQEAAQRHALELLGAQANAQKRATESLQGAADVAGQMRGASAQEGQFNASAINQAMQFNKKTREAYDTWRNEAERRANADRVGRGETEAGAVRQLGRDTVGDQLGLLKGEMEIAGGKGGSRAPTFTATRDLNQREINYADKDDELDKIL